MTPEQAERIREAGRQAARDSRTAQGLPEKITDPDVIRTVIALVREPQQEQNAA